MVAGRVLFGGWVGVDPALVALQLDGNHAAKPDTGRTSNDHPHGA